MINKPCRMSTRLAASAVASIAMLSTTALAQNRVLSLDDGGYVVVPHNSSQATPDAVTIEYWVKLSSAMSPRQGRPFAKRPGSAGQFSVNFGIAPGGGCGVELFGVCDTMGWSVPVDTWSHFAVTWSAVSHHTKVYINGVVVADEVTASTQMSQWSGALQFGDTGGYANWLFKGRLDNIRFWNIERSQSEILSNAMRQFSASEAQFASGLIGSWSFDAGDASDAMGQNSGSLNGTAAVVDDAGWQSDSDCNGDGIPDAWQIASGQLPDTNGNGVPDGCEQLPPGSVLLGPVTNPANGHRYYLLGPSSWGIAQQQAQLLGGNLTTINDAAENVFVVSTFGPTAAQAASPGHVISLWIGLSDWQQEGTFVWADGSNSTYTNFVPGEPHGGFVDEDYIGMVINDPTWGSGRWHDIVGDTRLGDEVFGVVEVATPVCTGEAAWSLLTPSASPPPRWIHAMAATGPGGDGSVVMFGGEGINPLGGMMFLNDTWVWNGVNWQSGTTPNGMVARYHQAMAGAPAGRVLLFGGLTADPLPGELLAVAGDTWQWANGVWAQEALTGPRPTPRGGATATFVSGPSVQLPFTLMFGGYRPLQNAVSETWAWNGSGWNQVAVSGASPAPRWGAAMAYDPTLNRVILFGGYDTTRFSDTWSFNPATLAWAQLSPTHRPSARVDHTMAYDPRRQRIVMYGDLNFATSDQWSWNGSDWEPDSFCGPDMWVTSMAPDATGKLILFGGSGNRGVTLSNETWRSDSGPCVCVASEPIDSTPGSTVVLTADSCSTGSVGTTTYVWKRSGTPVVSLPRISASADGSVLTINNTQISDSGAYYVEATSSCGTTLTRPVQVRVCGLDIGRAGGVPGSDGTLDTNDFIVFIDWFFTSDTRADRGVQGGLPGTDGHFDNNDFVVFIDQYFAGC